ncbi:hypothetical protein E6W39_35105 [Kitasatospora acidiphila]|uniref:Uncharacterized protein n=1 Tax=Kitasatospora acidiphila TaxID=2567942 RepID=A0A540WBQ2_9ACTN|nr:hypothetical protein [Kitasatospora acidiphila]TQF06471.1 hypothetical protein E6W39_35105 [Kitasatospora acidiphila]
MLTTQLKVSLAEVERLRELALLAGLHPHLDRPGALHLLHTVGVDSPADLLERAHRDPIELVRSLRRAAAEAELSAEPAVRTPWSWLSALGVDPARLRAAQGADRPPNYIA